MSEIPDDPEPSSSGGPESIERRALPRTRQWWIAGVGSALVLVVLVGVFLGGRLFAAHDQKSVEAASSPGTFRPTVQQRKTLTIAPVELHGFASEELTEGKIAVNGDHATPLFSPYTGRVIRVIARPGDTVKAGAALAIIEATEFVQAGNDLATADAQVKLSRLNEARKHALYDAKGGSLQDWQQAQADLTAAEAAANTVRNRLKILGQSEPEIAALGKHHGSGTAARLTAPIAGVVVDRQVGPGQYVQAGSSTPVFTIADPSSVWLIANVREADAGQVRVGQSVEVHVPAYPTRAFRARVTAVAAVIDSATHRLPVRGEIQNPDGALKPEMFANFRILTSAAADSPAVPESAVVYEGPVAHVWVLLADGTIAYRAIRAGRSNDGLVEVLDGLKAGEQIVIKGAIFVDQAAAPAST